MKVIEILEQLDDQGSYPGEPPLKVNQLSLHGKIESIMNRTKKLLILYKPYLLRGEIKNLLQIYKITSKEFNNPTDVDYATLLVTSKEINPYVKRTTVKMTAAVKNPSPEEYKLKLIHSHKVYGAWPINDIKYDLTSIAKARPDLSDTVTTLLTEIEWFYKNKKLQGEVTFNTGYSDTISDAVRTRYNDTRAKNKKGKLINPKRKQITISTSYAEEVAANQHYRCALSGIPMSAVKGPDRISIDRINSKHGYHRGNVQFLLGRVNVMKGNLAENKFLDWCLQIYNNSNIPVTKDDLAAALVRPAGIDKDITP